MDSETRSALKDIYRKLQCKADCGSGSASEVYTIRATVVCNADPTKVDVNIYTTPNKTITGAVGFFAGIAVNTTLPNSTFVLFGSNDQEVMLLKSNGVVNGVETQTHGLTLQPSKDYTLMIVDTLGNWSNSIGFTTPSCP